MAEPLEAWVEKHCAELLPEVKTHIEVFTSEFLNEEDRETLARLVMISLRSHFPHLKKG